MVLHTGRENQPGLNAVLDLFGHFPNNQRTKLVCLCLADGEPVLLRDLFRAIDAPRFLKPRKRRAYLYITRSYVEGTQRIVFFIHNNPGKHGYWV